MNFHNEPRARHKRCRGKIIILVKRYHSFRSNKELSPLISCSGAELKSRWTRYLLYESKLYAAPEVLT